LPRRGAVTAAGRQALLLVLRANGRPRLGGPRGRLRLRRERPRPLAPLGSGAFAYVPVSRSRHRGIRFAWVVGGRPLRSPPTHPGRPSAPGTEVLCRFQARSRPRAPEVSEDASGARGPLRCRCCPWSRRPGRRPDRGPSRSLRRRRSAGVSPCAPWPTGHRGHPPVGPRCRRGVPAACPRCG
jgi:hypothetical protein